MKFLDYAPVLHLSALTGERTPKLLEAIDKVAESRTRRIPTAELNRFVQAVTAVHPPASPGRREVRILYAAQTGRRAADIRVLHERRHVVSLLLRALSGEPAAGVVRPQGTPIRIKVRRRAKG